jgi:hypothetical protein
MRSVMDIGGSCASGGPFVPRVACPSGVPLLLVGSIWCGLIFAGIYAWQAFRTGAPSVGSLLWPALFLSLGYNFLEYGLHPPFGLASVEIGWLACAVVFGLMGGVPLLWAIPSMWKSFHGDGLAARARDLMFPRKPAPAATSTPWDASGWFGATAPAGDATPSPVAAVPTTVPRVAVTPSATPSSAPVSAMPSVPSLSMPSPIPPPISASTTAANGGMSDDIVSALERLEALHRSGALTDTEYDDAKRKVIEG